MEIKEGILGSSNGNSGYIRAKNTADGYENEMQEIISRKSSFLVRWGTLFFFGIVLMVGVIAWVIRYPEVVVASGTLNSINAPKEVVTRVEGKLIKLYLAENQQVQAGDILGYMESTANPKEVLELSQYLDSAVGFIRTNEADKLTRFLSLNFDNLGELQSSFQVYMQSLRELSDYLTNGFYLRKREMLNEDINYLKKMHGILIQQKTILLQDLMLADSTFKANENLKIQHVISSFEYRAEKSKLLAKEITLPQISSALLNNENQQHEKQKEIAELNKQIQQQEGIFIQVLNTFRSQLGEWKKKYLLIAPVEGKASFVNFIQEKQQLKAGQLICFINPESSSYYVEARIPQYNLGKVTAGQSVLLKFAAYPYQEFGTVKGVVAAINTIPTDSGYLAKIEMPLGLFTNYKKHIQYKNGLYVDAQILTENKRLLQRILENVIRKTNR